MHPFRERKLRRLALSAILIVVGASGAVVFSANASVAHAEACSTYWAFAGGTPTGLSLQDVNDSSCGGTPPDASAEVNNCNNRYYTINTDSWLTQDPAPGGTRLAESGRSGLIQYPNDCNWYIPSTVTGWGQTFTTPLYGCSWFYVQDFNRAWDYVCNRAY